MTDPLTDGSVLDREHPLARRVISRFGGAFVLPARERRRLHRRARLHQKKDQSEVCGVLLTTEGKHLRLQFVTNSSETRGQFTITATDVERVKRQVRVQKQRVIGFFHSHPISAAVPSAGDMRKAPARSIHLIHDVCGRESRLWYYTRLSKAAVAIELPLKVAGLRRPPVRPAN